MYQRITVKCKKFHTDHISNKRYKQTIHHTRKITVGKADDVVQTFHAINLFQNRDLNNNYYGDDSQSDDDNNYSSERSEIINEVERYNMIQE